MTTKVKKGKKGHLVIHQTNLWKLLEKKVKI